MLWFLLATFFVFWCRPATSIPPTPADLQWLAEKERNHQVGSSFVSKYHVFRLQPGEDLTQSIYRYARLKQIDAASIVSVVGSLTTTNIRYANDDVGTSMTGHFEIVSVVGNVDRQTSYEKGSGHIHISVADEKGITIGGHAMPGNLIYTTAEVTLVEMKFLTFRRKDDDGENGSGYKELVIEEDREI